VLFGLDAANPVLRRHLQVGGGAYVLDAGWLTLLRDCYKARVMPVHELPGDPAAGGGHDGGCIAAALAAVAAAAAHGLSPTTIRRRLTGGTPEAAPAAVDSVPRIAPATGSPLTARRAA
jgi:hypothetical protein